MRNILGVQVLQGLHDLLDDDEGLALAERIALLLQSIHYRAAID